MIPRMVSLTLMKSGSDLIARKVAAFQEPLLEVEFVTVRDAARARRHDDQMVARNKASSTLWVIKKIIFPVLCQTSISNS